MADQQAAALPCAGTGATARELAARLAERGYRVRFPPGRDPAVFRVTGLPAGPHVEVTAEDDGPAACRYTGRSTAEAAKVIARKSRDSASAGDTVTAVWGGIDVEWHYVPPAGRATGPGQVITALLAHLAVLDGRHDGKDDLKVNARCAAGRTTPGELLRLVMDGMTVAGFDVSPPEPGESRMTIACAGAQCTLMVTDQGQATWDYCPWPAEGADPALAADLAATLLTGRPGPHPWLTRRRGGISFKGLVGLELKARGLNAELAVYTDEAYFDAFAEIMATAPGTDGEAEVWVADDGRLTWTRSSWAEAAAIVPGPEDCGPVADPARVAAAIVATVARAMSRLVPGGQGRAA